MSGEPQFSIDSELVRSAFEYARTAHERDGKTRIEHPVSVALMLDGAGFGEHVIAAALLHDVIEDTGRALDELAESFGDPVADLVDVMTEDSEIEDYAERKDEHRRRVISSGPTPSSIYIADKLARIDRYNETGEEVGAQRLDHYRQTINLFSRLRPELPFLDEAERGLRALEATNAA